MKLFDRTIGDSATLLSKENVNENNSTIPQHKVLTKGVHISNKSNCSMNIYLCTNISFSYIGE